MFGCRNYNRIESAIPVWIRQAIVISITMLRGLAIIPLWINLHDPTYIKILGLTVLVGFADIVDGFLARRWNVVSDIGAVLDPLCDKLFMAVLLCVLVIRGIILPWFFCAIVVRECIALLVALIMAIQGKSPSLHAQWWGKLASVAQTLWVSMCLLLSIVGLTMPRLLQVYGSIFTLLCSVWAFACYGAYFYQQRRSL